MRIATIIGVVVREWGITPHEINARHCDEFAQEVIAQMGGYSDKCYDAECPNGVSDHRQLPFFKRAA